MCIILITVIGVSKEELGASIQKFLNTAHTPVVA